MCCLFILIILFFLFFFFVVVFFFFFFFQAEDGIRDLTVTGVQTCALPIFERLLKSRLEPVARRERQVRLWRSLAVCWVTVALTGLLFLWISSRFEEIGRASCRERV